MPIPLRQKAAVIDPSGYRGIFGPQLRIDTDYGVPLLEQGQLLIKNNLCGVNITDILYRFGAYSSSEKILGHEAAGTVAALGPGTTKSGFGVGDRVIWVYARGYAEYSAVPIENVVKLPKHISDQDAIGGLLSGLTALTLTKEAYVVKKGEWVLVHAAERNIGLLMVQIMKAAGAKVIGTVGYPERISLLKSLGVEAVFNYRETTEGSLVEKVNEITEGSWVRKVNEITKGDGVSVVYDFAGKETWNGSLEAVKTNGTIVWCGSASGKVPPLPLELLSSKCIKVIHPSPPAYLETKQKLDNYIKELFSLIESGRLKIRVHCVYFLEDVGRAHADLEGGKTAGKILLRP